MGISRYWCMAVSSRMENREGKFYVSEYLMFSYYTGRILWELIESTCFETFFRW